MAPPPARAIAGYPRGFWALFLTEMWERYSYFGIRALLVLFLVDPRGLALDDVHATAIYGLFAASAYLAGLPGGWIGDVYLGQRRAVIAGGALILAGNALLVVPGPPAAFYAGLAIVVAGTGLLKPNISAMVARLFAGQEARLDGAFTLYYMGICLGAALAAIATPLIAAAAGWRWGYAATAAGMALGLTQFLLARRHLPADPPVAGRRAWPLIAAAGGLGAMIAALVLAGVAIARIADLAIVAIALIGGGFFAWLLARADLAGAARRRLILCLILCLACALYWSAADLAGSSFTLFADRLTDRDIAGYVLPAGSFQSINPILILLLAPILTLGWDRLSRRRRDPGTAAKFAAALALTALGMAVMVGAALAVGGSGGGRVTPLFLIATYLLHTLGELMLSPVGLAAINRLAPPHLAGRLVGAWFLSVALGTLAAARLAGRMPTADPVALAHGYGWIGLALAAGAALLFAMRGRIARLAGGSD